MLLGVALMVLMRLRQPDFFQGRTLTRSTPALTDLQTDQALVVSSCAGSDQDAQHQSKE
jgi:hypothetical protein